MMKKILLFSFLFLLIFASVSYANEPYVISFQGKLDPIPPRPFVVEFELFKNAGATLQANWYEEHTLQSADIDANGIFNRFLGRTEDLEDVLFENTAGLWLKITVAGTPLSPAQALTAAPFAFVAKNLRGGIVSAESNTNIPAVFGRNFSIGAGDSPGVMGQSTFGTAVYGKAIGVAITKQNYGGKFSAAGGYGIGVFGEATNSSNLQNYGGKFLASGGKGIGVYGSGLVAGGSFESTSGHGVFGQASASGKAGVYGINNSGYGVMGIGDGNYAGGYFSGGVGVKATGNPAVSGQYAATALKGGIANSFSDSLYHYKKGSYGETGSGNFGILGYYTRDKLFNFKNYYAIYGKNDQASPFKTINHGAWLECTNGTAVRAKSISGKGLDASSSTQDAIKATSTSGDGVEAISTSGDGVRAISVSGYGVRAISTSGYGVYGKSTSNSGGYFESEDGYGIEATSNGVDKAAVYAESERLATPAIKAKNYDSSNGYYGTALDIEGKIFVKALTSPDAILDGNQYEVTCHSVSGTIVIPFGNTNVHRVEVTNRYVGPNSLIFLQPRVRWGVDVDVYATIISRGDDYFKFQLDHRPTRIYVDFLVINE